MSHCELQLRHMLISNLWQKSWSQSSFEFFPQFSLFFFLYEIMEENDAIFSEQYFRYTIFLEKGVHLKAGDHLVTKNGIISTGDYFVIFKSKGKVLCQSEIIEKNRNPVWNQKFCIRLPAECESSLVIEGNFFQIIVRLLEIRLADIQPEP